MTVGTTSLRDIHACLIVAAIGLALRVYGIGAIDLWGDEAFSWMQANRGFADLLAATAKDNYPPLHNIILYDTMSLFGDSEIALRAPSALFGTLTILVVFIAGKEMWDWRAGLIAAVLLAFSPLHIWHSIEARMYTLFCLTSLLYVLSAFVFLRDDSKISMLACFLSGVAMLYSHVFGVFVLFAVNAAVLVNSYFNRAQVKPGLLKWMLVELATVIAFGPWLVVLLDRAKFMGHASQLGMSWIPAPTPGYLLEILMQLIGGPLVLAVVLAIAYIGWRKRRRGEGGTAQQDLAAAAAENGSSAMVLLVSCLLFPPLIALGISLAFTPLVLSRYLISTLPIMFLLIGYLLVRVLTSTRAMAQATLLMLIGVAAILPVIAGSGWIKPVKTDLASFQRLRGEGDRVLYLGWDWPLFNYYVRDRHGIDVRVAPEIPADNSAARRIWLINLNGTGGQEFASGLANSGYREVYHATSPLILFSLFEKQLPGNAAILRPLRSTTEP